MAPIKAVGMTSMGIVMPHSTPNELMAWDTSEPEATRRWGMSTALAEPMIFPKER